MSLPRSWLTEPTQETTSSASAFANVLPSPLLCLYLLRQDLFSPFLFSDAFWVWLMVSRFTRALPLLTSSLGIVLFSHYMLKLMSV